MRPIMLTGFMGTGKSEVGRRLAQRLGRPFVDTDELIERRAGKSVAAVFATSGEPTFRALEREAVADAVANPAAIVALGGGAILDAGTCARVREAGVVVCLTGRPEVLLARIGDPASRPMLAGGDPAGRMRKLLDERCAAYAAAADMCVDTSDLSAEEVVEEIRGRLPEIERSGRWTSSA
jgi:shikimate kinase